MNFIQIPNYQGDKLMLINLSSLTYAIPHNVQGVTLLGFYGGEELYTRMTYADFLAKVEAATGKAVEEPPHVHSWKPVPPLKGDQVLLRCRECDALITASSSTPNLVPRG